MGTIQKLGGDCETRYELVLLLPLTLEEIAAYKDEADTNAIYDLYRQFKGKTLTEIVLILEEELVQPSTLL